MTGRRRAVAFLSEHDVARMLALPEGLHVVAVGEDFLRNGIRVLVEGEALGVVDEGCEAPRLPVDRLDSSALARQAGIIGRADVGCPTQRCPWVGVWEHTATLAKIADAVQQHLAEAHAGGEQP